MRESSLAKYIRYGIYATAVVPLIIFKDFISPFHFGKVIIFRSLIEILAAGYLILILKDRSYLPRKDKIFSAFLFFTFAFTITTIASVLPYSSFWGSLERMGGLWTFWHYLVFYIILTSILRTKKDWLRLFDITVFVGVLSAFYGFGQKTEIEFFVGSGGRERIFGTIGNAALFAGYQVLTAFLALTLFFQPKNSTGRKVFLGFSFIVMSIALLLTAVRGSVLGYCVGILIFVYLLSRVKNSVTIRKTLNIFIIALVLFFIASILFNDASFIQDSRYLRRITDLSLNSPTVQTRFWAWQAGLRGWLDNPKTIIFGWGPENFNIPFSKYFNPKFFTGLGAETLFDRAHNMFVEILVTMGVLGFAAYINIFVVTLRKLRRVLRKKGEYAIFSAGMTSLIVAYIIHNSFIFDTSANFIVFFTMVGFITFINSEDRLGYAPVKNKNNALVNSILILSVFVVPWLIYKTNILPAKANYATTRAIIRGWAGDFNGSFAKYKEALSYNVPGKYEYRHRLAQYLVSSGGPSLKDGGVVEAYYYTIDEAEKNVDENPVDYLPYLYVSRLNIILGKDNPDSMFNNEALKYSIKALELAPKFIRTYFEVAQAYLNKKDYIHAIEYFQKAVDLNPEVGISHGYLGAAKIESGDLSGADDLGRAMTSKNPYTPREIDFARLANAYAQVGDFVQIVQVYKKMTQINPNDPQLYASLATAYANVGQVDEAVEAARQAVKIDKSFESDAKIFIESLGRKF